MPLSSSTYHSLIAQTGLVNSTIKDDGVSALGYRVMMTRFSLDPRLEGDTLPVLSMAVCELRLLNDSRWPWLVLIPCIADAVEWHDLDNIQRQKIDREVATVSQALKAYSGCGKINIATIGNMVRQLHIHIVARNEGDANWPGPVWGYGKRIAYSPDAAKTLVSELQSRLEKTA